MFKCSLQYLDEQQSRKYYQKYHEHFDLSNSEIDKLRKIQYSIHAEHLQKIISKGFILDVGCSSGELLSTLKNKPNYHLYGIDPDEQAISIGQKKFGPEIQFSSCYLTEYETDVKFDCFVFRGTFQYLGPNLRTTLKKIEKISSKNSKIVMYSIPNSDSFLYYILGEKWHMFHSLEHTLIFNKKSILKLCEIFNYKPIEISYPYLDTPYANLKENYESLIKLIQGSETKSFPFWGNILQVVLEKS